jgi:glycosyltransferase involved in cell wall biosynthesis
MIARTPLSTKILFVIDSLGAGGAERSLAELLPALDDAGIGATIACLDHRPNGIESDVVASGADVRFLPRGPIRRVRALRRIIRVEAPDVVHTTILAANLAGRLASIGRSTTVLTSLVNTPYTPIRNEDPRVRPWALSAVRLLDVVSSRLLTDHFHAITCAVKEWAVEEMGLDPRRITVIHRGRDPERLGEPGPARRRAARRALGLRDDDEVVITVGRQEYQKGQRFLLEAIATLAPARPNVKVLVAGRPGATSRELSELIARPALEGRIHMLGYREDVPELLAASDVFAFPSLFEGLGGSVLEAMALGLPIVASDLPAVREVVEDGENALLVPVASADDLATGIAEILDHPDRAAAFGARSREIFLERFTSARSAEAMIDLYRDLVQTSSVVSGAPR